ncbi:MAG: DedA family protein [Kiritimatiellia bacterium]|nr:DedA family protein [Kiritimatiellia bacterium]
MHIEQWLEQYGYWAVFFGVFAEGPVTLTLAGFLAHQGYLSIPLVLIAAFTATFLVIEIVFFIGLVAGRHLLERWPAWRKQYGRFAALLEKYKVLFIIGFRFIYGSQIISPLVIGFSRIRPGYFSALNAVGAVIWTITLFLVGYFFGHAFEALIEDIKRYEKPISLGLVAVVVVYYIARRLVWKKVSGNDPR